jgi:hypothetical protein
VVEQQFTQRAAHAKLNRGSVVIVSVVIAVVIPIRIPMVEMIIMPIEIAVIIAIAPGDPATVPIAVIPAVVVVFVQKPGGYSRPCKRYQ